MGIGGIILLLTGIFIEGIPYISTKSGIILIILALFCTAFAFTIWNNVMRILNAIEPSMLMTTMLVQIALLVVIFLGETISLVEIIGMILVGVGVLMVQFGRYFNAADFVHLARNSIMR